jgi:hypothetical protein
MTQNLLRRLLPVITLLAGSALAHVPSSEAPRARKADPLDAAAEVPRQPYQSSLSRYQRYAEQPVTSWRQANDTVNRIGGWRAYAREGQQADAAAAPASSPSAPAPRANAIAPERATGGHAGHKKP